MTGSDWMKDTRLIKRVSINGETFVAKASWFIRIEYPGEYCMTPWLRIVDVVNLRDLECPIHKLDLIEYSC